MTPEDDHWSAMTPHLYGTRDSRDRDLDSLSDGGRAINQDLQEVAAFLGLLRTLGDRPAPPPSAQLAAVLNRGFTPDVPTAATTSRARGFTRPILSAWLRRGALAFGLSAGLSASLVGAAAASGQLPDGARAVVDRIVEAVTPFDVRDGSAQEPLPTVDDSPVPVPSPRADGAERNTRTVPVSGNDTPAEDGVKGRRSGEKSDPRTGHDRDSASETDAEPPESASREDRSGSADEGSDDDDSDGDDHADGDGDSDGDGDPADQGSADGAEDDSGADSDSNSGSDADGEGSEDEEESSAEPDQEE